MIFRNSFICLFFIVTAFGSPVRYVFNTTQVRGEVAQVIIGSGQDWRNEFAKLADADIKTYVETPKELAKDANPNVSDSLVLSQFTLNAADQSKLIFGQCTTSPNNYCMITGITITLCLGTSNIQTYHRVNSYNLRRGTTNGLARISASSYRTSGVCSNVTLGGTTDTWGLDFTTSDFTSPTLDTRLGVVWNVAHQAPATQFGRAWAYQGYMTLHAAYLVNIEKVTPNLAYSRTAVKLTGGLFLNGPYKCKLTSTLNGGSYYVLMSVQDSKNATCHMNTPIEGSALLPFGVYQLSVTIDGGSQYTDPVIFTYSCNTTQLCSGHGQCTIWGTPCTCDPYWTGNDCGTPDCSSLNNCTNQGSCNIVFGSPVCSCSNGYIGSTCNIAPCPFNCSYPNGECQVDGSCSCKSGYKSPYCAEADCSLNANCNGAGTCVAPHTCECEPGYLEPNCTVTCDPPCGVHQFCNINGTCQCQLGYTGPECSEIFNCANNCSSKGTCVAANQCECNIGWTGADCSTPDCSPHNCNGNGVCQSPYTCQCFAGWQSHDCSVPYCDMNCNLLVGGGNCTDAFTCTCNEGWNGALCQTPSCENCPPNSNCARPNVCTCNSGWQGAFCNITLECFNLNNCSGNGICVANSECSCFSGWLGDDCSYPDCSAVNNCSGNGQCISPNVCTCFEKYSGSDCSALPEINNLIYTPPSSSKSFFSWPIIGAIAVGALLLIATGLIVFLRYRRRAPKIVFIDPDYNKIVFGSYLKPMYNEASLNDYSSLITLLTHPELKVAQAVIATSDPSEQDMMARVLFYSLQPYNMLLPLLLQQVDEEIAACTAEATLFRADSMAIAIFHTLSQVDGIRWLWATLGTFLAELQLISEEEIEKSEATSIITFDLDLEVDPMKMQDTSFSSVNKYTLLLTTQKLFHQIMQNKDTMPLKMRFLLNHVSTSVMKRFPGYKYKAMGGFLFLRFIVPAIIAPQMYGLFPQPPDDPTQRKLILLSKVLQNLANEVSFGEKEKYMVNLNDFIVENLPVLHKFYDGIISLNSQPYTVIEEIPSQVQLNALQCVHRFLSINRKDIIGRLQGMEADKEIKELEQFLGELEEPTIV